MLGGFCITTGPRRRDDLGQSRSGFTGYWIGALSYDIDETAITLAFVLDAFARLADRGTARQFVEAFVSLGLDRYEGTPCHVLLGDRQLVQTVRDSCIGPGLLAQLQVMR